MRLIFIRHGEPDYTTDTLTENGKKEAAALARRTRRWDVDEFYASPLGRAQETAAPTLEALHRTATTCSWLQEFNFPIRDPLTGADHCPWDLMPQYFTADPMLYDREEWVHAALYRDNPEIASRWEEVKAGLDEILAKYGYTRTGLYYQFAEPDGSVLPAEAKDLQLHGTRNYVVRDADDEKTVVLFCHLGVTCVCLAYLLGISPVVLWQGTCIPPTGVTIVNAEKRLHNASFFRVQALGDCSHLLAAGVPISGYASFAPLFQK
ncbi:MAG: histidine phosphatase family protein [Lachnospiraceae bacterium]